MPDVRNCKKCGKIFNYIGGEQTCSVCRQLDEDDFKRVKEYLYDNPGASMSEISSVLDISVEKIKRFLREGRLEIVNQEGNIFLECVHCGKAIKSGRLCPECERDLARELKSTAGQMGQKLAQNSGGDKNDALRYLHKDIGKPKNEFDK